MPFSIVMLIPFIGMPGIGELAIIALIVVVLFGATKIPALGKGLGEGIRNFKSGLKGDDGASKDASADAVEKKDAKNSKN